ncbi:MULTISPECIES: hypothetical protein [unclassified Sedimentibacter]|uniref:hypothetical protein n=1 Tax=unclassified Sedimentibacter TaxID=2649220 RepID=UPI0027E1DCC6|nr:hypothetical protein [Sedimentibacter sp. MB35-C1]WMJ78778.1 hypothetical protein RBQ61_07580 [Sedimentibacter sp. MB35-C1]
MNAKHFNLHKPYKVHNLLNLIPITETGFIKVKVITEFENIPLENSIITIYASLDELIPIETVTTDGNGDAPVIEIPVAYNPNIAEMSPEYPYTDYNIRVMHENYYPVLIYDIQVFPNITTNFIVHMNRIPTNAPYPRKERTTIIPRI